ncbi:MAG: Protease Do [Candidatus Jorgensenbacteria bacterium GW2011_GWA1_48_11]|uniref:Protease Do n=1 Tax=Candidatus Jorgensenbacteria bacterium GW2011_GWA1_48_11 TaxID=1618660 RepID=A0A0G1XAY9_9BACT|nr:MAG: Protease Do [Candidatus Jorgensenbacteria bacterium GW2011_GWA1_48_11]KKW11998.1 MAG: Protease Do [Candidatus Jorgensenbacteria bacterium GW2011_GWB1_49_9]
MSRKLLILIIIVGLVGGLAGSSVSVENVKASLLDDFLNLFRGNATSTTTGVATSTAKTPVALYKPVIDYEEAVIGAVKNAAPSVVSIVIAKDLPVIENCPYNPFGDLPPEFQQFFGGQSFQFSQPCEKGTKLQEVGGGTGFFVSADGLILTNKHVVTDASAQYTVLTNDGKKYDARVLARDPVQDLAVIKIDGTGFKPVVMGNSDSVQLGQTAIAIGNALGEFRNTVSVGVISGLARTVTASGGGFGQETLQGVFQTDAAINPGNSGGPLLNLKGEVIGINVAMASGAQSIGFAIPINQAKRDVNSVKQTGGIQTPYLGVRYLAVTPDLAEQQKLLVDYGALVRGSREGPAVIPDSPAAKAGIEAEDVILELDGQKIDQDHSLGYLIQQHNVGDSVGLKVWRGGRVLDLSVTFAPRPTDQ